MLFFPLNLRVYRCKHKNVAALIPATNLENSENEANPQREENKRKKEKESLVFLGADYSSQSM